MGVAVGGRWGDPSAHTNLGEVDEASAGVLAGEAGDAVDDDRACRIHVMLRS